MQKMDLRKVDKEYIVAAYCSCSTLGLRQEDFYVDEGDFLKEFAKIVNPSTLEEIEKKEKLIRASNKKAMKELVGEYYHKGTLWGEEYKQKETELRRKMINAISLVMQEKAKYEAFYDVLNEMCLNGEPSTTKPIVIESMYGGQYNIKVYKDLVFDFSSDEVRVCYTAKEEPILNKIIESFYNNSESENPSEIMV